MAVDDTSKTMDHTNTENLLFDARFAGVRGADRKSLAEVRAVHEGEDDAALVRAFIRGSKESFAALVDRHTPMVYRFAYRYVMSVDGASDIVQDVFIKAWKNMGKFDPEKSFVTWLLTITKNTALDAVRKRRNISFSAIEADGESGLDAFLAPYVEQEPLPNEVVDREYAKGELGSALRGLQPSHRHVLTLRYVEDMKFREIAAVLGEPIDTVKSKHRRALIALRKLLHQN